MSDSEASYYSLWENMGYYPISSILEKATYFQEGIYKKVKRYFRTGDLDDYQKSRLMHRMEEYKKLPREKHSKPSASKHPASKHSGKDKKDSLETPSPQSPPPQIAASNLKMKTPSPAQLEEEDPELSPMQIGDFKARFDQLL